MWLPPLVNDSLNRSVPLDTFTVQFAALVIFLQQQRVRLTAPAKCSQELQESAIRQAPESVIRHKKKLQKCLKVSNCQRRIFNFDVASFFLSFSDSHFDSSSSFQRYDCLQICRFMRVLTCDDIIIRSQQLRPWSVSNSMQLQCIHSYSILPIIIMHWQSYCNLELSLKCRNLRQIDLSLFWIRWTMNLNIAVSVVKTFCQFNHSRPFTAHMALFSKPTLFWVRSFTGQLIHEKKKYLMAASDPFQPPHCLFQIWVFHRGLFLVFHRLRPIFASTPPAYPWEEKMPESGIGGGNCCWLVN